MHWPIKRKTTESMNISCIFPNCLPLKKIRHFFPYIRIKIIHGSHSLYHILTWVTFFTLYFWKKIMLPLLRYPINNGFNELFLNQPIVLQLQYCIKIQQACYINSCYHFFLFTTEAVYCSLMLFNVTFFYILNYIVCGKNCVENLSYH